MSEISYVLGGAFDSSTVSKEGRIRHYPGCNVGRCRRTEGCQGRTQYGNTGNVEQESLWMLFCVILV